MSIILYICLGLILLAVLLLVVRKPSAHGGVLPLDLSLLEETGRRHVTYFPQIRQAMASNDFTFLSSLGRTDLENRLRKERRLIVLAYLPAIRTDFQRLLGVARAIAVLSPEVHSMQEWERFRITVRFFARYEWIRFNLALGTTPLPQLGRLTQLVSSLSIQMELAMKELGERAALASNLASPFNNGGGINAA